MATTSWTKRGLALLSAAIVLASSAGLDPAVDWQQRGRPVSLAHPPPLKVGIDASYPPFAFVDPRGQLQGLEVDLAHGLADQLGLAISVENADFGNGLEALVVGRYDLALAGLVPSRDQEWQVWFSEPYFEAGVVLVGPAERLPASAATGTLAAERGSPAAIALARQDSGTVQVMASLDEAVELVVQGHADAVATDRMTALGLQATYPDWAISQQPLVSEPLTIATPRRNRDLHHAVDAAIVRLRGEGFLTALEGRWLGRGAKRD